jgi:protein-S-isoprenylcysteine O-methyltransferase Ste14
MLQSHIILAAGWILFCIAHSVFASLRFKQFAGRWMGTQYKFYRFYYTIFAFISFAVIMIYLFTMKSFRIFESGTAVSIAGTIVALSGFIIMTICIRKYFMRLSGIKALLENKAEQELMITGIHKHVRHPLYLGTFIFIWGLLLLYPYWSLFIADAIITIYTLVGLQFEEKKLVEEFGEAYKIYKQKVPMLIPRFFTTEPQRTRRITEKL